MSEQELLALAKFVEGTSEILWKFALIRVYGEALQSLTWLGVFFVTFVGASFGSLRAFQSCRKTGSESMEVLGWLLGGGGVLSLLLIGNFLSTAVVRLAAPELFAIRLLMGMRM